MLFSIIDAARNGHFTNALIQLILTFPILIIALSFHEAAHGYIAYKCGDRTAFNLGRVTLNPAKHIDPIGLIAMLIFGYGWAKPVPINTRNFDNPKRGMALTGIAGPITNLLLGVIGTVFASLFAVLHAKAVFVNPDDFSVTLLWVILYFFHLFGIYNFLLMAFNLIPLPPFDGSRFMLSFLPPNKYFAIMQYERQILIGVFVVLFLLSRLGMSPFGWIANKLFDLIYLPVAELFAKIIL